jgi:hypothetical protein
MTIISLVLLAVLPLQVESSRFTVSIEGERVGTEEFSVVRIEGGFLATGHTRLEVNGQSVDVRSRMELDASFNPVAYEYRSGDQVLSVEILGQAAEIEYTVGGQRTPYDVRFPSGGMIIDDNFSHHYMLVLYRLGEAGGTVPVFVPQQMTLGALDVARVSEGNYELRSESIQLRATTDEEGRLLRLTLAESNVVVER